MTYSLSASASYGWIITAKQVEFTQFENGRGTSYKARLKKRSTTFLVWSTPIPHTIWNENNQSWSDLKAMSNSTQNHLAYKFNSATEVCSVPTYIWINPTRTKTVYILFLLKLPQNFQFSSDLNETRLRERSKKVGKRVEKMSPKRCLPVTREWNFVKKLQILVGQSLLLYIRSRLSNTLEVEGLWRRISLNKNHS